MELLLHAAVLLIGAVVLILGYFGQDLLERWSAWQRFKAFVWERLRGLFTR